MMKNKISFVGSVGVPAKYGGFETLVEQLCLHLNKEFDLHVYCSSKEYSDTEQKSLWNNVQRHFISLKPNGYQSILYDIAGLLQASKTTDLIFLLGCSGAFFIPLLKLFNPKKTILFHPDGKEWKRTKWSAIIKLYLLISTKIGLKFADGIIFDNKNLTPTSGKLKHKSSLIHYGGDQYTLHKNHLQENYSEPFWLTIARAEPENNLELIARAISETGQNWILISNFYHTSFGNSLMKKYKNFDNIHFIQQNYCNKTIARYINSCKGYIHGHSAGGTNPSLISAMFSNKPLICHQNEYNMATTNNFALFFSNSEELKQLISQKTFSENTINESAKYALNNYTWKKISLEYKNLFKSFL